MRGSGQARSRSMRWPQRKPPPISPMPHARSKPNPSPHPLPQVRPRRQQRRGRTQRQSSSRTGLRRHGPSRSSSARARAKPLALQPAWPPYAPRRMVATKQTHPPSLARSDRRACRRVYGVCRARSHARFPRRRAQIRFGRLCPQAAQRPFLLAVEVDAEGHIGSAKIVDAHDGSATPPQFEHLRQRVIALLGGGLFALQNSGRAGRDLFRITITLSDRAVKEESEPAQLVERGFEPPRGSAPGRAYFTLASGRHFEAKVEVLGSAARPKHP